MNVIEKILAKASGHKEVRPGDVVVAVENGILSLSLGGTTLFSSDLNGRISHIIVEQGLLSVRFPEGCTGTATFRLGPAMSMRFLVARLDGSNIVTHLEDGCQVITLSGGEAGSRLDCYLTPLT